jgi:hypothetical protein
MTTAPDYMRSLKFMSFGVTDDDEGFSYIDNLFLAFPVDANLLANTIQKLGEAQANAADDNHPSS